MAMALSCCTTLRFGHPALRVHGWTSCQRTRRSWSYPPGGGASPVRIQNPSMGPWLGPFRRKGSRGGAAGPPSVDRNFTTAGQIRRHRGGGPGRRRGSGARENSWTSPRRMSWHLGMFRSGGGPRRQARTFERQPHGRVPYRPADGSVLAAPAPEKQSPTENLVTGPDADPSGLQPSRPC